MAKRQNTLPLGRKGESAAACYLEGKGYRIIARHASVRAGEIDLIARDPDGILVFVEVKTRRSSRFGTSLEAFTLAKRKALRRSVGLLLKAMAWQSAWRVDAVGIDIRADGRATLRHVPNIAL